MLLCAWCMAACQFDDFNVNSPHAFFADLNAKHCASHGDENFRAIHTLATNEFVNVKCQA